MRIKLIKHSTGFGYGSKVCEWIGLAPENIGILDKFKKFQIIDIPYKVARSLHNAVDVDTGIVVSKQKDLTISQAEILILYKEEKEKAMVNLSDSFKKVSAETTKLEKDETKSKKNK